jgi:multisubunit Na+/H+ antiporter MnhB subunit
MSKRDLFALLSLLVLTAFLLIGAASMREFGEAPEAEMDDYIIQNAQRETGANNAVTSVVFDYRGFDTLGEATVLFAAVVGVIVIFRREIHE